MLVCHGLTVGSRGGKMQGKVELAMVEAPRTEYADCLVFFFYEIASPKVSLTLVCQTVTRCGGHTVWACC